MDEIRYFYDIPTKIWPNGLNSPQIYWVSSEKPERGRGGDWWSLVLIAYERGPCSQIFMSPPYLKSCQDCPLPQLGWNAGPWPWNPRPCMISPLPASAWVLLSPGPPPHSDPSLTPCPFCSSFVPTFGPFRPLTFGLNFQESFLDPEDSRISLGSVSHLPI